jgi:hypothetical protein
LNFGDDMSASLLEAATGREVRCVAEAWAEVVGLGSILHRFTSSGAARRLRLLTALGLRRAPPLVWGSGFAKLPDPVVPRAVTPLVLRGPETARLLHAENAPFGDPGLLVADVFPAPAVKTHFLGLVPHYTDKDAPSLAMLAKRMPRARIIDVEAPYAEVLGQIAGCEAIASSSLHGIIAADSYGLPAVRLTFGDNRMVGDLKFRDYARSIGRDDLPVLTMDTFLGLDLADVRVPDRKLVETRCAALLTAAKEIP